MKVPGGCILAALMAGTVGAKSPDGLLLDFRAGQSIDLLDVSVADYVTPPRFRDGPSWSISVESAAGDASWADRFTVPRAFHAAAEEGIHFSLVVPRPALGSRVVLHNQRGERVWARTIDAGLMAQADGEGLRVLHGLEPAYAATAKLMQSATAGSALSRPDPRLREILRSQHTGTAAKTGPGAPKAALTTNSNVFTVSGHVAVNHPILVRAYEAQTGKFVLSTEQFWATGRFEIPLPAGTYVFEADDNLIRIDSAFFYRAPIRSAATRISANVTLADIVPDSAIGDFLLSATVPCPGPYPPPMDVAVVAAADGTRIERQIGTDVATPTDSAGNCTAQYRIRLSPGVYAIEAAPPGWELRRYDGVRIDDGAVAERSEAFSAADRTLIWRGQTVDASGRPIRAYLDWHDGRLDDAFAGGYSDDSGRFEVPYRKGWAAQFEPMDWYAYDATARATVAIGEAPLPSTVVVGDLAFQAVEEDGMLRLYGDGNRKRRFNILFLGDGYAEAREPYIDTNGNGRWDGYAWQDLDQDGVYSPADRVTTYGSPEPYSPPQGSVPTELSEPFTDLNGDGVLSNDDSAIFRQGVREFMRALLGSDVWNAHRDAFNAYVLYEPSEQAGYSVVSESGTEIITRKTLYQSRLELGRSLLSADRSAVMHRALAALPEVDLVVLLINQPVWNFGRGNVTLSQPGSLLWPSGLYTSSYFDGGPAHELGHFIGSLCDEYDEFPGVHPQAGTIDIWCPNVSYSPHLADIPWATWLAPDIAVPTRNLAPNIGVYEGADYYPGGAYRPSLSSIMRETSSPLFNAPSRAALERAIARRTQAMPSHSRRPLPPLLPRRD